MLSPPNNYSPYYYRNNHNYFYCYEKELLLLPMRRDRKFPFQNNCVRLCLDRMVLSRISDYLFTLQLLFLADQCLFYCFSQQNLCMKHSSYVRNIAIILIYFVWNYSVYFSSQLRDIHEHITKCKIRIAVRVLIQLEIMHVVCWKHKTNLVSKTCELNSKLIWENIKIGLYK